MEGLEWPGMESPLRPPLASPATPGADRACGTGDSPTNKPKRRRRPGPPIPKEPRIPKELRAAVTEHACVIARQYRHLFAADRQLKDRVLHLVQALLPPRARRRGRPGLPDVTNAIRLRRQFRRQHPGKNAKQIWARVYPAVILGYDRMTELERESARNELRQRVADRLRKRARWKRTRKIPA